MHDASGGFLFLLEVAANLRNVKKFKKLGYPKKNNLNENARNNIQTCFHSFLPNTHNHPTIPLSMDLFLLNINFVNFLKT